MLLGLSYKLPEDPRPRWMQDQQHAMATPKSFMTGAWARGPHFGLTRTVARFPAVSRLLASILQGIDSEFMFSTCTLARNVVSKPHRDKNNAAGSWNLVVPCSKFQGGELWIQCPEGSTFRSQDGEPGTLWDTSTPTRFDPQLWHATAPWGGDRIILIGFHVRHVDRLKPEDKELLRGLNFMPAYKVT